MHSFHLNFLRFSLLTEDGWNQRAVTQKFHNLALLPLDWLTLNSSLWRSVSREKVCFLRSTKSSQLIFTRKVSNIFFPNRNALQTKSKAEPAPYFLRWPISPWTSKPPSHWYLRHFFYESFLEYPSKRCKFDCPNFTLWENESQQSRDSPKIAQRLRVRDGRRANIPIPTAMFQAFSGFLSQCRNWAESY